MGPQPAESLCFPHQIEETFVSCLGQRGRIFQSSTSFAGPSSVRGRNRAPCMERETEAQSSDAARPSRAAHMRRLPLHPFPTPALRPPAPWVTPLAQEIGEFCPLASELAYPYGWRLEAGG